jgi:hypothetical protein
MANRCRRSGNLQRVVAAIRQPAEERSIERYWKMPEQSASQRRT